MWLTTPTNQSEAEGIEKEEGGGLRAVRRVEEAHSVVLVAPMVVQIWRF